jgi:hypothetical protein
VQRWPGSNSLGSQGRVFILFGAAPGKERGRECPRQVSAGDDDNDDAPDNCNDHDVFDAGFTCDSLDVCLIMYYKLKLLLQILVVIW